MKVQQRQAASKGQSGCDAPGRERQADDDREYYCGGHQAKQSRIEIGV
jgi:hypothetical protein